MAAVSDITQITMYVETSEDDGAKGGAMPQCAREALKALESADGWKRAYNGGELSHPELNLWVFDWESTAHRSAFLNDEAHAHAPVLAVLRIHTHPAAEPSIGEASGAQTKSVPLQVQVHFDPPYAPEAFGAPVTEIALGTLRGRVGKAEMMEYEALMCRIIDAVRRAKGMRGAAWGKVLSDDGAENESMRYVLVVGWDSIEAQQVASASKAAQDLHKEVKALAEYEIRLVELTEYEKGSDI